MKSRYFHGTSADNLQSILENGLNGFIGKQIWKCSSGLNYFWDSKKVKKAQGCDTIKDAINQAKQLAASNAEFSLIKSNNCRRIVIECDLSNYEIGDDTSCRNMEGAILVNGIIDPKDIIRIWIDKDDLSFYKSYFASCYISRKDSDDLIEEIELSNAEIAIAKAMLNMESNEVYEYLYELVDQMEICYEKS